PTGFVDAGDQFVLRRIVTWRLREGHAIGRLVGEAHAEAIGLHAVIGCAVFTGMLRADPRKHAAGGIARHDVGADLERGLGGQRAGGAQLPEVVTVMQHAGLYPGPFLTVVAAAFAADVVAHAGGGHEIALVGGVDEHLAAIGAAAEGPDRHDPAVLAGDAPFAVEPLVTVHLDFIVANEVFEDLLGDVGLEVPHRLVDVVHRGLGARAGAILLGLLPRPGRGLVVVLPDPVIEFLGQATDDGLVAAVGPAESAGREAAEVLVGRND